MKVECQKVKQRKRRIARKPEESYRNSPRQNRKKQTSDKENETNIQETSNNNPTTSGTNTEKNRSTKIKAHQIPPTV